MLSTGNGKGCRNSLLFEPKAKPVGEEPAKGITTSSRLTKGFSLTIFLSLCSIFNCLWCMIYVVEIIITNIYLSVTSAHTFLAATKLYNTCSESLNLLGSSLNRRSLSAKSLDYFRLLHCLLRTWS